MTTELRALALEARPGDVRGQAMMRAVALIEELVEGLEAALREMPVSSSAYQDALVLLAKVKPSKEEGL
jgi:hypothetical protein